MKKRMLMMLIPVVIVFGGIMAFYFFKQAMMKKYLSHFTPPPATVTTTKVKTVTWHPYLTAVGTLEAQQSIEVIAETAGKVTHIYFKSGDYVEKGAPLVDLDAATEQAQLKGDQATLNLAELDYQRSKQLYVDHAVSDANVDQKLSTLQSAQAKVEGDMIAIANTRIKAPFAGKLGMRQVSVGAYIAPPPATNGDIVALRSVDPMLVQFSLPQQDLPKLYLGQPIQLMLDALPNKIFTGKLTAMNAEVTQTSRTILAQAKVANPQHQLLPGMFVNVKVLLPTQQQVVVVPQTAIVYSLYGNSVYVVNQDHTVTQTFITLGQTQGIDVVIEKGLKAGSEIVTSGQLKLHNGSPIVVNNKVLPN